MGDTAQRVDAHVCIEDHIRNTLERRKKMASDKERGTTYRGPETQVAVRTGPAVAVGQYFIFHPDNGGYYTNDDNEISKIEEHWTEVTPSPADSPEEPAAAPPEPTPVPEPEPAPAEEPAK